MTTNKLSSAPQIFGKFLRLLAQSWIGGYFQKQILKDLHNDWFGRRPSLAPVPVLRPRRSGAPHWGQRRERSS